MMTKGVQTKFDTCSFMQFTTRKPVLLLSFLNLIAIFSFFLYFLFFFASTHFFLTQPFKSIGHVLKLISRMAKFFFDS